MALDRHTPTVANYGSTIESDDFADLIDEEIMGLWDRSIIRLGSVSGTNTITATATPTLDSNKAGQWYILNPAGTNTGAVTLNIDTKGAIAVRKKNGDALSGGEFASGDPVLLHYDGTYYKVMSYIPVANDSTTFFKDYIAGFSVANNQLDTSNDIDIGAGKCRDYGDQYNMIGGAMTKQIDASWAAGTNQGGMLLSAALTGTASVTSGAATVSGSGTTFLTDFQVGDTITVGSQCRRVTVVTSNTSITVSANWSSTASGQTVKRGGLARDTKYRVLAIRKDADATIDYCFSTRAVPADLPSGYTAYRRIFWVMTSGGAAIRNFLATDNFVFFDTPQITDYTHSGASINTTTSVDITSLAPPNVRARMRMEWSNSSTTNLQYFGLTQSTVSITTNFPRWDASTSTYTTGTLQGEVLIDNSGVYRLAAVFYSGSGVSTFNATIFLLGYQDMRIQP